MNFLKIKPLVLLAVVVATVALTGCKTVSHTNQITTQIAEVDSLTPRGKMTVGKMKANRISMKVTPVTMDIDDLSLAAAVSGKLTAKGFSLDKRATRPYANVIVTGSLKQFDRMGNFHLYQADGGFFVERQDGEKLVTSINTSVKGKRVLGEEEAQTDALKKLGDKVGDLVVQAVTKSLGDLESTEVRFNYDFLEDAFGGNPSKVQNAMRKVAAKVQAKAGVEICELQSVNSQEAVLVIFYNAVTYPSGVVHSLLPTSPDLKSGKEVDDFVQKFFY